nr:hypothetical protein BaRGS_012253 [Batillaria attramentaria]
MEQQKEQMKIQKEQMEQQKEQMEQQNEQQKEQMKEQMRIQAKQHEEELAVQREQMELWPDYWSRFCTFLVANAVPDDRKAQVFLTNQTPAVYKQLANLAAQQNPKTDINDLTMDQIVEFMKEQFDPKLFIVRERFKFWSNMEQKPGETLQELAARIRQDAATCDFPSIQDPQDEALRQRFICSVNNEAVLKALFKVKDTELDFAKAVKIAIETEDAAKVAKETVYGSKPRPVNKVKMNNKGGRPKNHQQSNSTTSDSAKCYRLDVPVTIQDQQFTMELDTATTGNFVSVPVWKQLGKPKLDDVTHRYESASKHDLPVLGTFKGQTKDPVTGKQSSIPYIVTKIPDLNLLGRNAIQALGISVDNALGLKSIESQVKSEGAKESHPKTSSTTYASLQKDCHTLCDKFPDLFKEELGCLKDFELEVKFKSDAKPVFHKARPVPFALRDDLTKGYEEGIAKGVWKPVQFNDYGTPVVPIRKTNSAGALKPKLRICGDYSVGINDQLADHRHPMPLPEELMQKLGGGFGYTKIDLADAYNQIKLAPESQRRLALSTHRGVLLQQRLPFGIKSAPGYFQEIMENLTSDLPGVAVFQDDILTSGKDAKDHLSNLERLLTRLNDKGLRCRREKCLFAQPSVEYLGHTLSAEGISKGSKVEAVLKMPPPSDVSSLKSFLGSVQFYGKFIPNLATMAEPLYRLTKKANPWKWGEEEQAAFEQLKQVLSSDQVLVHFDPEKPVGLACDASNVGIGAVLFHRYPDGSERPIANVSKTLTAAERNYSQIHKEALAIIYGLRKFYQYLYGRQFILVTDHKPLTALFGPKKGTPLLAANRLARWALWLNQFDYTIEYRKTADHGNADALSRLPSGDDIDFDREESGEDTDMVCAIRVLSLQVKPFDANILRQESGKDPVIATVMRYVREGWPLKHAEINEEVRKFQKLSDSLSICNGCLIYGTRVVIPQSLQPKILDLLHIGHFGMERMKQLARTAVYWPGIDAAIEMTSRRCDSCGEHQNKPSKPPVHPWMLPEKPWSRVHLDHAINFMGTNWLVITDAYSKYPCIHPTSSTSTRATLDLLEEDFAHFGYPHTLVSDNATTFVSEEFQSWCKERGITHLTGAPYHPATNGAAERLVQTFKQALRKSSLPPKRALQEFLMQYRRMPTSCGFSPSELLMSRQIRTRIDTLLPSPAHIAQGKQSKEASKTQVTPDSGGVAKVTRQYKAGDPVYALYYGPHHAKQPRWVPAVVKKSTGTRCFNVKVVPRGPVWRRHWEQLRPRYASEEDSEPGDSADASELPIDHPMEILENVPPTQNQSRPRLPKTKPPVPEDEETETTLEVKREIDSLLDNGTYDRTMRPHYQLGQATRVEVDVVLNTLGPVNELDMEMSASFYFRQQWQDPRLAFSAFSRMNTSLLLNHRRVDSLWLPDIYFSQGKKEESHDVTVPNLLIRLHPDGTILYSQRLTVTFQCLLDLRKFPLDEQTCHVRMESYSHTTDDMYFAWSSERKSLAILENAHIPDFVLTKITAHDCTATYATGTFPCLEARLRLSRQIGFYMTQIYIPSVLTVSLSWVSFWLEAQAIPARISVGLLTVLTITTQSSGVQSQLPRVPYIKSIDVWMSVCLVFVFAAYMHPAFV